MFWLVFAGGLAPVSFFFVTGVGRGLQASVRDVPDAAAMCLAPALDLEQSTTTAHEVLRSLLGDRTLDGFSYPPCPWLAYPLTGFLLGGFAQDQGGRVRDKRFVFVALSLLLSLLGLTVCTFFRQHGMVFLRWG